MKLSNSHFDIAPMSDWMLTSFITLERDTAADF